MKNRFDKKIDENILLDEVKDLINHYGMEKFLSAIITILYSFQSNQKYMKDLIKDLLSTLERYKNRYE